MDQPSVLLTFISTSKGRDVFLMIPTLKDPYTYFLLLFWMFETEELAFEVGNFSSPCEIISRPF